MLMNLYYSVAQERLKNDANASDPSTKRGLFVDPFFDDDMRDQGIAQTGAIVDGCLTLPISSEVVDLAKDREIYLLPHELEPVVSQELQTGSMKINPYCAFDPIPADVNITLNVDHWTEIETQWLSPITYKYYYYYRFYRYYYYDTYSAYESLESSSKRNAEFMRQVR
jgi:hypothetical protein